MIDSKLFSQQVKSLSTVDVRFDKRSELSILNQHCIDKYQENAYMLGRIFSVDSQQVNCKETNQDNDAEMEAELQNGEPDQQQDQDNDEGGDDDYALG